MIGVILGVGIPLFIILALIYWLAVQPNRRLTWICVCGHPVWKHSIHCQVSDPGRYAGAHCICTLTKWSASYRATPLARTPKIGISNVNKIKKKSSIWK